MNWPIPLGRPVTHRFIRYEANDATRSTSNELMFIRLDVAVATRTNFDGKGATQCRRVVSSLLHAVGGISVFHAARL